MPYVISNYVITLFIFRSNHHRSRKFHKFSRKTTVLESLFINVAGLQVHFMFVFLDT